MSPKCELNAYVRPAEEVITYLEDQSKIITHLDLGSADLWVVRDQNDIPTVVILSSSGHAAAMPADALCAMR
jgi:hypothetical protein